MDIKGHLDTSLTSNDIMNIDMIWLNVIQSSCTYFFVVDHRRLIPCYALYQEHIDSTMYRPEIVSVTFYYLTVSHRSKLVG